MPGNPARPTHQNNPVGQTRKIRAARGAWRKHARGVRKWVLAWLRDIPATQIEANAGRITVNRYEYQISPAELDRFVAELARRLANEGVNTAYWQQVRAAYEQGTGDEVVNLQTITDGLYEREVLGVIQSQAWQQRVALIQARVFEEMRGFEGDTARDLARVLRGGVENGLNPREVAGTIRKRFDVSQSRANRIARTEITQAYRRARWDEDADAQQRLDIRTGLLWFSALSETTREWHAARHGQVYTQEQVRRFYSEGANAINCQCSQSSVLLDENGQPANQAFIDRVKASRK
jgi:SPP1 gp7 family putative phage head morphogenesis protein